MLLNIWFIKIYSLCSDIFFVSIFFSQILPFATPQPPTSTKFFCVPYWKYSRVILNMHVLSKISHTFKSNSQCSFYCRLHVHLFPMSRPFCKVFVLLHKTPKTFIWNASLAGLDGATCGVASATRFHSVATNFQHLIANLATKIFRYFSLDSWWMERMLI